MINNFLQNFKALTVMEGKTYAKLREPKKTFKSLKGQLEKSIEEMKENCSVYPNALSCRSPIIN